MSLISATAQTQQTQTTALRVAAIQMVSSPDLAENLQQAQNLLTQAVQNGAMLALLPEYFCLMGQRDSDKRQIQEEEGQGRIQTFLADCAQQLKLWLVGGTLPLRSDTEHKVRNACLVFSPNGDMVARYDKIHLFSFHKGRESYNEGKTLQAGQTLKHFVFKDHFGQPWKTGLSVCYDLRFPELYQRLASDLLLVPAAFTHTTGQAHWEVLLRARAIENQAFVLAAAQGGTHRNGRSTWGHSMIVDPWGTILAERTNVGPGVVIADLDWKTLSQVRTQLPALQHRVPLA